MHRQALSVLLILCSFCATNLALAGAMDLTCGEHPGVITELKLHGNAQQDKPTALQAITFGQVFAAGDLPNPGCLQATVDGGASIPLQIDSKARHPDGSVRHAVITVQIPAIPAGSTVVLALRRAGQKTEQGPGQTPAALLQQGFTAGVQIVIDGMTYTASADQLLRDAKPSVWLAGPLVNEWHVAAPLKTADGKSHPNLSARFAIRSYTGMNLASVDMAIENDWAFSAAPQNYDYDVQLSVGGKPVYSKTGLKHYHHARWRKVLWWGQPPEVDIAHDTAYLIASKAVPNYDQSVGISGVAIRTMTMRYSGAATEPMGNGMAIPYMPTTGGRPDIGLLPGWAVSYLLSMDARAKLVTLGAADQAGSWSMHYRDQKTGRPVSLQDFPYMTLLGHHSDTINPKTKKSEEFPDCGGDCKTPYVADSSHEPALAYLPYLVTGDYYYLEELEFWTMYDLFQSNPSYRANIKGLFHPTQVRGQAWTLRDLANAAYIVPDADPFKKQFEQVMSDNLDWYNATYQPNGSQANQLGALVDANAREYLDHTGIAPWQDDFFTAAVGRAVELGFVKAKPLLAWKSQYPILRMTAPGTCWISGSVYAMKVSDKPLGPVYTSMAQAYLGSVPKAVSDLPCASMQMAVQLKLQTNEMTGYSSSPEGFPSNMQPALALSVQIGTPQALAAWKLFMSRANKPDYSTAPQFDIIPRQ